MIRFRLPTWIVLALMLGATALTSCPVLDDPEEEEEEVNDGSQPDPQGSDPAPAPEDPPPPH